MPALQNNYCTFEVQDLQGANDGDHKVPHLREALTSTLGLHVMLVFARMRHGTSFRM
jgi:hypothetical protein